MDQLQPDAAQARISELRGDPAWVTGYLAGDSAKHAEMTRLHEWAHPQAGEAGDALANPNLPAGEGIALESAPRATQDAPVELGEEMLDIAPPAGPWEYDLGPLKGNADTPENLATMQAVQQSLYEAKIPSFAVNVVRTVGNRNLQDNGGKPLSDAQLASLETAGRAELERRYGAEGAKALIADAAKCVRRLAGNAFFADYFADSGAGNDPAVIEAAARLERGYFARTT